MLQYICEIETTGNPEFIDYLCRKTSWGSFILPNFRQKGCGEKVKENNGYRTYRDNCLFLLNTVQDHLIKHYLSKSFFYSRYRHALDIYVFEMNKKFRLAARDCGTLERWVYPELPEDLCLFDEKERCILYTQTHESECRFYGENEAQRLNDWGVSFEAFEIDEQDIPTLKGM